MAPSAGMAPFSLYFAIETNLGQICNFLNHMVNEINLDAIIPNANGHALKTQFVTDFDPVRRKLQVLNC